MDPSPAPALPGLVGSSPRWLEISQTVADLAGVGGHVLITGERGVGKRRVALAIAEVANSVPVIFDTGEVAAVGTTPWLEKLAASLRELTDDSVVVVTRLERLEPEALQTVADLIRERAQPTLATAVGPDRRWSVHDRFDVGLFNGSVHIPALRHRVEDIAVLAHHFDALHGAGRRRWTDEALEVMERYLWPGNVSELEQVVQEIGGGQSPLAPVDADQLPEELRNRARRRPLSRLEEAEIEVILAALTEANGNKDLAAHLIGIHRATLYRKLQNYGLDRAPDS